MNKKIIPLFDRIVVERIDSEAKTVGGLYIPDTAKEKPQEALVISVGPGRRLDSGEIAPMTIKPGDRVLFGKYSGSDIDLKGVKYSIMREDEILGILQEVPN